MKEHPAKIIASIAELEGPGSMTAKQQIIKDHLDVPEFVKVVEYAQNPFKNFYVQTVPGLAEVSAKARQNAKAARKGVKDMFDDEEEKLPWAQQFSTMFELLDKLRTRQLPPNSTAARDEILKWARKCGAGTIQCFRWIIQKDLRCGLGTKTFNKIQPGWIPVFNVQLAQPFNEKKLVFPCIVDPKFDGERCLAFITYDAGGGGSVTFFSRNGIEFQNYGCFADDLLRLFKGQGAVVADCEVINKAGFQTLQKTPTLYDPNFDSSGLQIVVFDWMTADAFSQQKWDLTQAERLKQLTQIFKGYTSDRVVMVDSRMAKDLNEAYEIYTYWVSKGLEGVILKQPDGLYEFRRSDSWVKLKPRKSEDLEVVDIELGDANKRWVGKCGSIVVGRKTKDGNVIRVGVASGLTEYDHENIQVVGDQILWKSPEGELLNIKGKLVEVIYDCETEDGSLRFPRIKRRPATLIRTDK